MKSLVSKLLLLTALPSVALIVGIWLFVQHSLNQPVVLGENLDLNTQGDLLWTIDRGSGLSQVSFELDRLGVIEYPSFINAYAALLGSTTIQAGTYRIQPSDSARSLLDKFNRGDVVRYKITFPEGWSFKQWIAHMAKIAQFSEIKFKSSADILKLANIQVNHPEGWLFPDTYSYSDADSAYDILYQAHLEMQQTLDRAWQKRGSNLPYQTPYEALIMASIIEKETGLAVERSAIAGVFVRRLQRGMRLQTDPTVIYGMGDSYKGNIRRRDLLQTTAYNTYRIDGLPPTPIAMPGAAAIDAALNPKSGSSLYFVARGDGSHHFSDTIDEHHQAVRKYQINQRQKNYQSMPKPELSP